MEKESQGEVRMEALKDATLSQPPAALERFPYFFLYDFFDQPV